MTVSAYAHKADSYDPAPMLTPGAVTRHGWPS